MSQPHDHRPKNLTQEQWRDWVDEQLAEGAQRFDAIAEQAQANADLIEANTVITAQIKADTTEIVKSWNAMTGFVKVMNAVGNIGKWFVGIVAFSGALYALLKYGQMPK